MTTTFYSTKNKALKVSLKEAVMKGLALDGGLFMPEKISKLNADFFKQLPFLTFSEIALKISSQLLGDQVPHEVLKKIIEKVFTFEAPLVKLNKYLYVLELFHGPTLSFKDFGARFMAQLMSYYNEDQLGELHVLVATSGDTGSAVAHGFLNMPGIKVWILYPGGQVSAIQESQLTSIGHNVTAVKVNGTFDDCQTLVKMAFNDQNLCKKKRLTSANSINIARLIPQIFYYFYAFAQLKQNQDVVFSVPSGNFGNLTAGLLAHRLGLPVKRFIASTNVNDSIPKYLESGVFNPRASIKTLSNAMDVGNPSNFARMLDLYGGDPERIRMDLVGYRFTDEQTKEAILELKQKYHYLADPHGAVGYLGLKAYQQTGMMENIAGIFLETAHPAKFPEIIEPIVNQKIGIPDRLQASLNKAQKPVEMPNRYDDFKDLITMRQ